MRKEMWSKPTEKILKYAKENGLTTSLDPQASITGEWAGAFDGILNYVDLLILMRWKRKILLAVAPLRASRKLEMGSRIVGVKV
jgi:sugar/nucleoside kinase (ribokinase family)